MFLRLPTIITLGLTLGLAACLDAPVARIGDGSLDAQVVDGMASADMGAADSARRTPDVGPKADAAPSDAATQDAASSDSSVADSSVADSSVADSSPQDAATPDGSLPDAGPPPVEVICAPWAQPGSDFDQSVVPTEVLPLNPDAIQVVLVADSLGPGFHPTGQHESFAGMAILAHTLCQVPGVVPVMVADGWPQNEAVFDSADVIAFYTEGGQNHPLNNAERRAVIARHIDRGVGFAAIHYALEPIARARSDLRAWLGGVYESGFSDNPWWAAEFEALPEHPVLSGIEPFVIFDEWYFNLRFGGNVTTLLGATPANDLRDHSDAFSGRRETLSWVYERPEGGRSFGFTGGHFHGNWTKVEDGATGILQRRLVAQGLLWTAGVAIPADGLPAEFPFEWGGRWLDAR